MDAAFARIEIAEKATVQAGKAFGREWDKAFYEAMMEIKRQHGCNLWFCGEEEWYGRKVDGEASRNI